MVGLVNLIKFESLDFAVNIGSKVLFLKLFPSVTVGLDSTKSKFALFFGEFTVLSTRVKADNILDLCLLVGLGNDIGPFFIFRNILRGFFVLSLFFSGLCGILFPFELLFFLVSSFSLNVFHFSNTSVKGTFVEAGIILKSDSHVRSESRNLKVVHARFADNFLNNNTVRKLLDNGLITFNGSNTRFGIDLRGLWLGFSLSNFGILEDIKSKSLVLSHSLVN